jgi:hypothetical protein
VKQKIIQLLTSRREKTIKNQMLQTKEKKIFLILRNRPIAFLLPGEAQ